MESSEPKKTKQQISDELEEVERERKSDIDETVGHAEELAQQDGESYIAKAIQDAEKEVAECIAKAIREAEAKAKAETANVIKEAEAKARTEVAKRIAFAKRQAEESALKEFGDEEGAEKVLEKFLAEEKPSQPSELVPLPPTAPEPIRQVDQPSDSIENGLVMERQRILSALRQRKFDQQPSVLTTDETQVEPDSVSLAEPETKKDYTEEIAKLEEYKMNLEKNFTNTERVLIRELKKSILTDARRNIVKEDQRLISLGNSSTEGSQEKRTGEKARENLRYLIETIKKAFTTESSNIEKLFVKRLKKILSSVGEMELPNETDGEQEKLVISLKEEVSQKVQSILDMIEKDVNQIKEEMDQFITREIMAAIENTEG